MNRTWITGLTLASVAGSGGAFAAAATSGNDTPVAAQAPSVVNASDFVQAPTSRTINYQVGAAGTVTLTVTNGVLNVDNTTFGTGWTGAPRRSPARMSRCSSPTWPNSSRSEPTSSTTNWSWPSRMFRLPESSLLRHRLPSTSR